MNLSSIDSSRKVLQPRMSEGVEHLEPPTEHFREVGGVLQPRMSEGVEHQIGMCSRATRSRCYNLGCRKALSTYRRRDRPARSRRYYNLGCRKALSTRDRARERPRGQRRATTSDVGRR